MSGDVRHHYSSASMSINSSRHQQQSWNQSQQQQQQQQHYSTEFEHEEVDDEGEEEDDHHRTQLHQPLYPASEWDQKLDRMLDELQLSISPQRKAGTTRIEAAGGKDASSSLSSSYILTSGSHQQSSRQTVSSSSTSQEHRRTASGCRMFDSSSVASNPSVDMGPVSSVRDARSQSPEQRIALKSTGGSYNEGAFSNGLSRGGSMSSVRSQSSQQRQYSEYHLANRRHDDSSFAAGMPSATSADDEPFGDDFQAIPSSVSERARAWSSRGVAYNFASETTTNNNQIGPATEVETTVKKTQVARSSSTGQQPLGYGPDEIDSALSDLMRVSQMATRSAQPERDNEQTSRTAQSHHHHHQQLSTQQVHSSNPVVMQSGTTESSTFSSSSSSSSSSRQQFYSYSSNAKASESNETPVHYATPDNRLKSVSSISSSSLSSTVHHAHVIDYSRISQKQIRAAGIQSMSHHQLNSPICNFPDHEDFPLYNLRIIPESSGLLCNVAKHPQPMCNVEKHPNFPLYAGSPPCPPGSQDTHPICNIKIHPALQCNFPRHPDYPGFTTGCSLADKETICNVPSHPICNSDKERHPHDRNPQPSKCNIPGHPEYPDYMSLTEPQTEPFCDVPGHPFGLCNIQTHPQYPDMMGPEDREAAPYCFIPSHPELLCNIAHHPDYPGYMTEAEMPSEPICNVPRHPFITQSVVKRNPPIPNQQDPFSSPYAVPTTLKPKMYQRGIGGSPLPTIRRPEIDPGLQSPPKKLDDLMDTFNGGPYQPYTSTPRIGPDPTPFTAPSVESNGTTPIPKQPLFAETPKKPAINGASAPPVYYPPEANEMFAKTSPEAPLLMQQSQSHSMSMGGGSKGKMKYSAKYSAGGSESDTKFKAGAGGAAVIPICLPVCCAMPCVIM